MDEFEWSRIAKISLILCTFLAGHYGIVKGDNITLQGRFGILTPRIYYVIEDYVMSEGLWTDVCQDRGYTPFTYLFSNNQYLFIKYELLNHFNWSTSQHLWFSLTKPSGTKEWLYTVDCSDKYYGININTRDDPVVPEECLIVNMSAVDEEYTFWSSRCQESHSVICYKDTSGVSSSLMEYYNKSIVLDSNLYFSYNFDHYDYERCWRQVRKSRRIVTGSFITFPNGTTSCLLAYLINVNEEANVTLVDDPDINSIITYKLLDDDHPTKVLTDIRTPLEIKNTNLPCITERSTASTYDASNVSSVMREAEIEKNVNEYMKRETLNTSNDIVLGFVTMRYSSPATIACCGCVSSANKSEEQINKEIEERKNNLTVDKRSLSSYIRTKISIYDDRPASVAIGSIGIVVMVIILSLISVPDIPIIVRELKRIWC